jgi:hypothetical protein
MANGSARTAFTVLVWQVPNGLPAASWHGVPPLL